MRTNLENIRKVDQYLANELSESDTKLFEQELAEDQELQQLLDEQTLFIASVKRAALRSQIENAAGSGGFNFTQWLPIIIVGLMICSVALWASWPTGMPTSGGQEQIEYSPIEPNLIIPEVADASPTKLYECGGHQMWVEPDIQHFSVNPAEGATIEGKDGILIIVPTHAFLNEKGELVTAPVDFELVEALTLEDMVLYNLKTTSDGEMLESGGMFYTNATADGKPLQINPDRPLYIEIPTANKQAGMKAFSSEIIDGELNWVDPKPLQKFLVKVDLNELDFLPTGFTDTVKINMPYRNHKTASEQLVDSLYYALGFGINRIESATYNILSNTPDATLIGNTRTGQVAINTITLATDVTLRYGADTLANKTCGVNPTAVQTIKKDEYANTFIATREFETRIRELHEFENGQELLDLYVNNLGKNLWEVDQMASQNVGATGEKLFAEFSREKLTNLKDAKIYQARLSAFYKRKQGELTKAQNKLVKDLQRKNDREIRAVLKEYKEQRTDWVKSQGTIRINLPSPSAATAPVYPAQWATMGWSNIDQYIHILMKQGVKEVAITVKNMPQDGQVYQWLNVINTMTGLLVRGEDAIAAFPKNPSASMANTYCIAIGKDGDDYFWDYQRYNPYQTDSLEIAMALTSLEAIRQDLRSTDVNMGQITKQMKRREEMVRAQLKWRQELAEKRKKREAIQKELNKRLKEVQAKHQMEEAFMDELRVVSFPCEIYPPDETPVSETPEPSGAK